MVKKAAETFNGITIAYVMGFVNAVLACVCSFGVSLSPTQQGSIVALVNAGLILCVHMGHRVGEAHQEQVSAPPVTGK